MRYLPSRLVMKSQKSEVTPQLSSSLPSSWVPLHHGVRAHRMLMDPRSVAELSMGGR